MIYPADLIAPDKRLAEDERARQCKKLTPPGKAEGDTKSVTRADAVEPEKAAEPGPIWRSLALAQGRDDSHSPATTPTSTGSPLTSDRQPLDPLTRIYFEANFGRDFRNVRVHTGASAVQFVQDHSARAVTLGTNIYFSANRHRPRTVDGQRLLAHELVHIARAGPHGPSVSCWIPIHRKSFNNDSRRCSGPRGFAKLLFWNYLRLGLNC